MTLPALVIGLAVMTSVSHAQCPNDPKEALFPSIFTDTSANYIQGEFTDNPALNEDMAVDFNGVVYTVFDNGMVAIGNITDGPKTPSGDLSLSIMGTPFFATIWANLDGPNVPQAQFEIQRIYKTDQYDSNGNLIGPYKCVLAAVQERLKQYDIDVTVDAVMRVSWKFSSAVRVKDAITQLILVVVGSDVAFAIYNYNYDSAEGFNDITTGNPIVNSLRLSTDEFGYSCDSSVSDFASNSNHGCGVSGSYVYNLNDLCGISNACPASKSMSCRSFQKPADTCDVRGYCQRTGKPDEFKADLTITKHTDLGAKFMAIPNTASARNDTFCGASVTDNGDYWKVKFETIGTDFRDECGVLDDGNGFYSFLILRYEDLNLLTYKEEHYNFTCNPDQLVQSVAVTMSVADIASTVVPSTQTQATIGFGNQAYPWASSFKEITGSSRIGNYAWLWIKWMNNGAQANSFPYGGYVKDCWYGYPADFTLWSEKLVTNGCSQGRLMGNFINPYYAAGKELLYDKDWLQTAGPFRFYRHRLYDSVWLKCTIGTCVTTHFNDSKCIDSCANQYVNSPNERARREAEDGSEFVLTAHLTLIDDVDEAEGRKMQSCVESTMAYVTIVAMVIMALVATTITAMLYLKMRARKLK